MERSATRESLFLLVPLEWMAILVVSREFHCSQSKGSEEQLSPKSGNSTISSASDIRDKVVAVAKTESLSMLQSPGTFGDSEGNGLGERGRGRCCKGQEEEVVEVVEVVQGLQVVEVVGRFSADSGVDDGGITGPLWKNKSVSREQLSCSFGLE